MPGKKALDVSDIISNDKTFNQRIHDLKEALLVIDGFVKDMSAGYKFDDAFASKKSEVLIEVFSNLKGELKTLAQIYERMSS